MIQISHLPPEKLHELADEAEDEAYGFPPGPRRQRLLVVVYQMRATANHALWLGDEVSMEAIETPKALRVA